MTSFRRFHQVAMMLCLFAVASFTGCGGSSGGSSGGGGDGGNPVPAISSLSPVAVVAGSPTFTLIITGSNFISSSTVLWGGSVHSGQYISSSEIQTQITAGDVSVGGKVTVAISNPAPGGGTSALSTFIVGTIGPPSTSHTDWQYIGAKVDAGFDNSAPITYLEYDQSRNQVFLSVPARNVVLVFDSGTHAQKASIYVSSPLGMDLTPDASTLYVGSGTNFLYAIDPSTLRVKQIFNTADILRGGFAPVSPVTLSDGRLLILPSTGVDGSSEFVLWSPTTGTTTSVSAGASVYAWGAMTRSGNHASVLIAGTTTGSPISIFNAATSQLISIPLPHGIIERVAANPVKDQYAVSDLGGNVELYDSQFNHLGSIRIEPAGQAGGQRLNGMVFSGDGSLLHLFVDETVQEYDTHLFQQSGVMSQPYSLGVFAEPLPFAEDANRMVFAINEEGLDFVDITALPNDGLPLSYDFGYSLVDPTPDYGSLQGGISAIVGVGGGPASGAPTVSQVYLGNRPVWELGSNRSNLQVVIPNGSGPETANMLIQLSDGTPLLAPSAFSYGPQIARLVTTGGNPDGSGSGFLAGYGFGNDPSALQITIGGQSAAVEGIQNSLSGLDSPFPTPIQAVTYTIPKGNVGTVDLQVSNGDGSATASGAFRYAQPMEFHSVPGTLESGVYDSQRHLIYFTGTNQIQVFSISSGQWLSPFAVPQASTAQLVGISLSSNGNTLAVGDQGNQAIITLNPGSASTSTHSFTVPDGGFGLVPGGLAVTNEGIVYYLIAFAWSGFGDRCQNDLFWKLNTTSGTTTDLTSSQTWCVDRQNRVLLAPDESTVFIDADGQLKLYSVGSGSFVEASENNFATSDMALSGDGSRLIQQFGIIDSSGNYLGSPAWSDIDLSDLQSAVFGEKLDETGAILFQPWSNALDLVDLGHFIPRERFAMPYTVQNAFDSLVWDGDADTAFLIVQGGILEVPLSPMPLVLASLSPSSGAAGASVTLFGSGFVSGMRLDVDGTVIPVTVTNEHNATIQMPTHAVGAARITLSGPDSQVFFLDDAFTYTSSGAHLRAARGHSIPIWRRLIKRQVLPSNLLIRKPDL